MDRPINEEIQDQKTRGVLLIMTGPSGAGKNSVIESLISTYPTISRVITTTTRKPRNGEKTERDYFFITREEFEQKIANHEFFEWMEYRGELYGTEKRVLHDALEKGQDLIWQIDVKGVKNIKEKVRSSIPRAVFVFMTAPTVVELENRIKKAEGHHAYHRFSEPMTHWEEEQYKDFDYLVVNENGKIETTVKEMMAIIRATRLAILPNGQKKSSI